MAISESALTDLQAIAAAASPGPWRAVHRCIGIDPADWRQDDAAGLGWEILDGDGNHLGMGDNGMACRGADAYLMAAAPALATEVVRLRAAGADWADEAGRWRVGVQAVVRLWEASLLAGASAGRVSAYDHGYSDALREGIVVLRVMLRHTGEGV